MPRNTTRLDHLLNVTVWAMAVAPTATTVLFVTYGAHARLALGRAALIALNFLDPTGFMEWFRD
ncbi:MAG: hypothetical protein DMG09_27160 [Acidobacteria bacterium]|nr:MAG: hypothetical protein DMG09_27160 [Acidobacteriota bacterium]